MSNNKSSNNPTAAERKLVTAGEGVRTALPQNQVLVIDGEPYTVQEIEQKLGEYAVSHAKVRDLRAQLHEAVTGRRKIAPEARTFLNHLKAAVVSFVGEDSALLEKFGWKPRRQPGRSKPEAGPTTPAKEAKPTA